MLSSRIRLISLNSQSFFISNFFLQGTGETAKNMKYLLDIGVTHLLNTAENDCNMNPKKYGKEGICYKGFRCPDLPQADISQFFDECVEFKKPSSTPPTTPPPPPVPQKPPSPPSKKAKLSFCEMGQRQKDRVTAKIRAENE